MCVSVLPSSMSVHQMHEVHKRLKEGSDPREVELQMFLSCHVGVKESN